MNEMVFRHYLKEWRIERGMTLAGLAEAAGNTKGELSRYERGSRLPTLPVASRLMVALDITPAQFFAPPQAPSADALLSGLSPEDRERCLQVLGIMVGLRRETAP
jgi:transcriptional regulator with XRE-family HTH domain